MTEPLPGDQEDRLQSIDEYFNVQVIYAFDQASFNTRKQLVIYSEAQPFVAETFTDLTRSGAVNEDGSQVSVIHILVGVIGLLLIVFSSLLIWTSYTAYIERKNTQADRIGLILRREALRRDTEVRL